MKIQMNQKLIIVGCIMQAMITALVTGSALLH